MAGRDAVIAAADRLAPDSVWATSLHDRHQFAFVDDAQELTKAELRLLSAIFGERKSPR